MKNLDSLEALANSPHARCQVGRIMQAVNYAVKHVQDHEMLSNKFVPLSDLAIKHGVTDPQYFKVRFGDTTLHSTQLITKTCICTINETMYNMVY